MNRRIAQVLDRPATARVAVSLYSAASYTALKLKNPRTGRSRTAEDGFTRPPDRLIFLVNGTIDWDWYFKGGAFTASEITDSITRQGTRLEELGRVLDFGCGSGRIIRHFARTAQDLEFYGVDYNSKLVAWSRDNLAFARFSTNTAEPPLDFPDQYFGLVYAYSVFTHLPEDAQASWRDELHRIVRPGGFAWITVLNEQCRTKLSPEEVSRYDAGELVIRFAGASGANQCAAYPPDQYLKSFLSPDTGWEIIERGPTGPSWAAPLVQDYLLLKRK